METVYYHLSARKIAVGELASGGETYRYAFVPRKAPRPLPPAADNVLDFQSYREKLAPPAPARPDLPDAQPPARAVRRPADRAGLASLALDLCATVAIVVFAAVASLQFLQVL